jgi:GNAT superfamily N-acetyltransferase
MGTSPLTLRRATERDREVIISLIDKAADWLRTMNTDQWSEPWPSEEDRRHRIMRDLQAGKTWIAWDGDSPVATLTADSRHSHQEDQVWPDEARREQAVYVCRLVVSRDHAGRGLGAELLDWAGLSGRQTHGAQWVRVDVWTTNEALHAYYRGQGFEFYGYSDKADDYPSAALFQKPTDRIRIADRVLFQVESEPGTSTYAGPVSGRNAEDRRACPD